MIVALPDQRTNVGETTLALYLARELAREGKRIGLADSDPSGCAFHRSEQRPNERRPRLFRVIGRLPETPCRVAPVLARDADKTVVDGPPRVAAPIRSALLAAALADMLRALLAREAPDDVETVP